MLVIFISVGLYARRGAFAAVATFLITFIAALAAVNYYPLAEWALLKIHRDTAAYADGVGLLLAYFIVFLLLQYLAIIFIEENIKLNAIVNGLVGAVFGGMAAVLFAGILTIGWFMLPGSMYYKSGEKEVPNVAGGVDEKLLTVVRFMANDRINGKIAFDPAHDFMRTMTNKYAAAPVERQLPEGRPSGGAPGIAPREGGLRPRDELIED